MIRHGIAPGAGLLLLSFLLPGGCSGAPVASPTPARAVLEDYLSRPEMRGARLGILVQDLATGQVLLEENADQGFSPASTMKLLTATSVLHNLPSEFRFRTHLYLRGTVSEGVLRGDLILICPGDPSFGWIPEYGGPGAADFDGFVQALKKRGIRRIEGRLLAVPSPSPAAESGAWPPKALQPWIWRSGWEWDDFVYGWGAEIGDFVYHGNRVSVRASRGEQGIEVTVTPEGSGIRFEDRIHILPGRRSDLEIQGLPKQGRWTLAGTLTQGGGDRVWAAVPEPGTFLLDAFEARLDRDGIQVHRSSVESDRREEQAPQWVAVHASPPRDELLRVMLHRSDNLYAERLGWAAAFVARGVPSQVALPPELVTQTTARSLEELGVDPSTLRLVDASGLSRRNLLNPRSVVGLLARQAHLTGPGFGERLPLAGEDGTLTRRFGPGSPWHRRIRAKTGTITGITALAGYLLPGRGRSLAFSVYLERPRGRAAVGRAFVDGLLDALAPTLY